MSRPGTPLGRLEVSARSQSPWNRILPALVTLVLQLSGAFVVSSTQRVSAQVACQPLPDGVVGFWRFEDNLLDSASGASALLTGNESYAVGSVGTSLGFDGMTGLSAPNPELFNGDRFTFEGWINPTNADGHVDMIINKETNLSVPDASMIQFEMGIMGELYPSPMTPKGSLLFSIGGVLGMPNDYYGWADSKTVLPFNAWSHVAFVVEPGRAAVYVNGVLVREVTGLSGNIPVISGPFRLGSRSELFHQTSGGRDRFNGQMDDVAFYSRSLNEVEIGSIVRVGAVGKCVPVSPVRILSGLASQSIPFGGSTTFKVAAYGSLPVTYEWRFNGNIIPGESSTELSIAPVLETSAGLYSVNVCNPLGCVQSEATLNVTPGPSTIFLAGDTVQSPGSLIVPVGMYANGNENAVSFSVSFDANLLKFEGVKAGSDEVGVQVLVNESQAANGFVGLAIAFPAGQTVPKGKTELLRLKFRVAMTLADYTAYLWPYDNPTLRQVADASANVLPAKWVEGAAVLKAAELEGDVFPQAAADKKVTVSDWVQIGRWVAGLDPIDTGMAFQRSDCAPLASRGNGVLTVSDWVQAGRFAVGLDPMTSADGPVAPAGVVAQAHPSPQSPSDRVIQLRSDGFRSGEPGEVSVVLAASGEENAVAFSMMFDPNILQFIDAVPGADTSGAVMNVNNLLLSEGRLGLAVALGIGHEFSPGSREIARLRFVPSASAVERATVVFADTPIYREVASPHAEMLPSAWRESVLDVFLPPVRASVISTIDGGVMLLNWTGGADGVVLESATDLAIPNWKIVETSQVSQDGLSTATVPLGSSTEFFRVRRQ